MRSAKTAKHDQDEGVASEGRARSLARMASLSSLGTMCSSSTCCASPSARRCPLLTPGPVGRPDRQAGRRSPWTHRMCGAPAGGTGPPLTPRRVLRATPSQAGRRPRLASCVTQAGRSPAIEPKAKGTEQHVSIGRRSRRADITEETPANGFEPRARHLTSRVTPAERDQGESRVQSLISVKPRTCNCLDFGPCPVSVRSPTKVSQDRTRTSCATTSTLVWSRSHVHLSNRHLTRSSPATSTSE